MRSQRNGRASLSSAAQLDLPLFAELPPSPAPQDAAPPVFSAFRTPPSSDPQVSAGAVPLAPDMRQILLNGAWLPYRLRRSSRRTIGFVVDDAGLTVTAPRWIPFSDIESAIAHKRKWIVAKLAEWQQRVTRQRLPTILWNDGATLPYLGRTITVRLASACAALEFDDDAALLALGLPAGAGEQQIKDRVQGWLQQQARTLFAMRLDLYADKLGVRYRKFALSSATGRWGSCTSEGNIRLNWRLIHFPLAIIDYVVAHELAHLKEMNHSPRFWEAVGSIFPDYSSARDALRKHPPEQLPVF